MSNPKIIASMSAPKQRMTRPYAIVILHQKDTTDGETVTPLFSVNRKYTDNLGGMDDGHYDLTLEKAWKLYGHKVRHLLDYSSTVFEGVA